MEKAQTKQSHISEIEKAAIFYGLHNGLKDQDIYLIAHPGTKAKNISSSCTPWKNSQKIAPYWNQVKNSIKEEERQREEGRKARQQTTAPANMVNFTDRDEFINYLNTRANEIQDEKLKNDMLKTLADLLQYKKDETAKDATEVQRFYTPVICSTCSLYLRQAQGLKDG